MILSPWTLISRTRAGWRPTPSRGQGASKLGATMTMSSSIRSNGIQPASRVITAGRRMPTPESSELKRGNRALVRAAAGAQALIKALMSWTSSLGGPRSIFVFTITAPYRTRMLWIPTPDASHTPPGPSPNPSQETPAKPRQPPPGSLHRLQVSRGGVDRIVQGV